MKPFFVYLLECADGSYYVGHTDDLARRMAQHAPRFAVAWTERGEPRSFAVDGDEAAAYAARRVFLVGAQRDPSVDPHSVRVVRST